MLNRPGVLPQHCQLHVTANGVMLDVPHGTHGQRQRPPVDGLIALRPGDSVAFDQVQARLASMESARRCATCWRIGALLESANDDPGATAVRPVLPQLRAARRVRRGVRPDLSRCSASTTSAARPSATLRSTSRACRACMRACMPTDDGLLLEDLGSANGTYINGKRVLRGVAKPGDEIGFDTVRFRLVAPGQERRHADIQAEPSARHRRRGGESRRSDRAGDALDHRGARCGLVLVSRAELE